MTGRRFKYHAQKLNEILSLLEQAIKRHDQSEQAKKILHEAVQTWRKREQEMEKDFGIYPKRKAPSGSPSTPTSSSNIDH